MLSLTGVFNLDSDEVQTAEQKSKRSAKECDKSLNDYYELVHNYELNYSIKSQSTILLMFFFVLITICLIQICPFRTFPPEMMTHITGLTKSKVQHFHIFCLCGVIYDLIGI